MTSKNRKNIQAFWSVQPASGQDSHLFTSEEEAKEQSRKWTEAVMQEFAAWERGETSFAAVDSRLESTPEGGAHQYFVVSDHALPGGVFEHEAMTQPAEKWEGCPGFEKVRWGNPATARP
ncbi:MAG: hypothetical protein ACO3EZ_17230 [Prochlorotrichaceae cyanobacterium]